MDVQEQGSKFKVQHFEAVLSQLYTFCMQQFALWKVSCNKYWEENEMWDKEPLRLRTLSQTLTVTFWHAAPNGYKKSSRSHSVQSHLLLVTKRLPSKLTSTWVRPAVKNVWLLTVQFVWSIHPCSLALNVNALVYVFHLKTLHNITTLKGLLQRSLPH